MAKIGGNPEVLRWYWASFFWPKHVIREVCC
jgi:hypothetical protein